MVVYLVTNEMRVKNSDGTFWLLEDVERALAGPETHVELSFKRNEVWTSLFVHYNSPVPKFQRRRYEKVVERDILGRKCEIVARAYRLTEIDEFKELDLFNYCARLAKSEKLRMSRRLKISAALPSPMLDFLFPEEKLDDGTEPTYCVNLCAAAINEIMGKGYCRSDGSVVDLLSGLGTRVRREIRGDVFDVRPMARFTMFVDA